MEDAVKSIARLALCGLVICAIVGFLCYIGGVRHERQKWVNLKPEAQIDTVYKVDTFVTEKPLEKRVYVKDSILVSVYTPMWVHDTIRISLPKEVKEYGDSTYKAQVSGYKPNLDWIEVYAKTTEITKTIIEPRKKWGFSVGVGPSVIYSPFAKGIDAGVGVFGGVTYTF